MKTIELTAIPTIMFLCYSLIELIKKTLKHNPTIKNAYPMISAFFGGLFGILTFLTAPKFILSNTAFGSTIIGMASGLSATGSHQILKHLKKEKVVLSPEEENAPPRYFITGDKHRRFDRLIKFCQENHLRKKDVIVILGDAGFNYYEDARDDKLKAKLNNLGINLFCLHGNKEKKASKYSYLWNSLILRRNSLLRAEISLFVLRQGRRNLHLSWQRIYGNWRCTQCGQASLSQRGQAILGGRDAER